MEAPRTQRTVHFDLDEASSSSELSFSGMSGGGAPAAPAVRKGHPPTPFSINNSAFSPGSDTSGTPGAPNSWTISSHGGTPASKAGTPASYAPASATLLASVQRVDDLRSRLEQLEATLREMESKAVEQLDAQLQEKVLATALKLVQQRCLVEGALDKQVQEELLQTARKVVERKAEETLAVAEGEHLARRLEFQQQGGEEGCGVAPPPATGPTPDDLLDRFSSHIEQGLGESMRRLERKADLVAGLLDQGAIDLLEGQLNSGLGRLEARLAAVEGHAAEHAALTDRVAGLEAAVRDQQAAVLQLVAALRGAQGGLPNPAQEQPATKAAAAATQAPAPPSKPAAEAGGSAGQQPAAAQREPRAPLPKLPRLRGASAAQRAALDSARERLAKSAAEQQARAAEEEEASSSLGWMLLATIGYSILALMGLAALAAGVVAVGVKQGVINPADLGLPAADEL